MSDTSDVERNLTAALEKLREATAAALRSGANHLADASRPLVPREDGDLVASQKVSVGDGIAAVSYGDRGRQTGAYAVQQHERTDLRHDDGQAQYLSQPFLAEREEILAKMGQAFTEGLR